MRCRKIALPKSNSWLPGAKMSGGIMLVSVMMCCAAVDARHQRGRERVAAMREDHVPPCARLGALGLDHGGKPGKAAALLAVGQQLLAHQVDVVDQDEGDAGVCAVAAPGEQAATARARTAARRRRLRRGMEPILDAGGA